MALDKSNLRNERDKVVPAVEAGPATADCIERTVAHVWQEVLQTPVSGPEDDFFEAGGDSLKAITFMMELERALGLELSLTLITEAPQFGRLCEAVRENRATRYVPLVHLKPGDGLPPVFIIPGLDGTVAGLFQMTRRMTYPGAVIGIQARGLTGEEPPHRTVEAMGADYLREVKARQPEGPYYLCGYSFGGLVAFEMARQLWERGNEIAMVGLFDATMSPLRWPLRSWLAILRRRMVQFAAGVIAAPMKTWPYTVWKLGISVRERLRGFFKSARTSVPKVTVRALIASARYRPGFYPGELTLFSPVGREPGLPSLQAVWSNHACTLSTVEIPGTHSTMFSAINAESTAASLTRCLLVCTGRTPRRLWPPRCMPRDAVRSYSYGRSGLAFEERTRPVREEPV
jgi:thioesterase domain-containing protein/acyl carrier protein